MTVLIERFGRSSYLSAGAGCGDILFLSGQVPTTLDANVTVQSQEVLAKIDSLLREGSSARDRIAFAMIWLKDIGDRDAFNTVWVNWVGATPPARACVQAELANPAMLVEVAVMAARG